MKKRIVTEDKIVTVKTIVTEQDRTIDYADIYDSVCVEIDDWHNEAPWESCDGWDHEHRYYVPGCYHDHEDMVNARGHVSHSRGRDGIITIDDDDIVKRWGCNGYHGCSKQVRAELIASVKRTAIDQLVEWYRDGWNWYQVCGEYEGYTASVCGIDCEDYAEEMRNEIAGEIAAQMEADDFVVSGNDTESIDYSAADHYRINREHRNNSYIVKTA